MTRIYLDNCCYCRPFDSPTNIRIILEAQAKMAIQSMIVERRIELAASSFINYEISHKEDKESRDSILLFVEKNAKSFLRNIHDRRLKTLHDKVMAHGIKNMDAYHVASAILLGCDYFITTDDRILKYDDDSIKILNPVRFIMEEV